MQRHLRTRFRRIQSCRRSRIGLSSAVHPLHRRRQQVIVVARGRLARKRGHFGLVEASTTHGAPRVRVSRRRYRLRQLVALRCADISIPFFQSPSSISQIAYSTDSSIVSITARERAYAPGCWPTRSAARESSSANAASFRSRRYDDTRGTTQRAITAAIELLSQGICQCWESIGTWV